MERHGRYMDATLINARLQEIRAEAERVKTEYLVLQDLTRDYERWLAVLGVPHARDADVEQPGLEPKVALGPQPAADPAEARPGAAQPERAGAAEDERTEPHVGWPVFVQASSRASEGVSSDGNGQAAGGDSRPVT
jgi:hypothetical protein